VKGRYIAILAVAFVLALYVYYEYDYLPGLNTQTVGGAVNAALGAAGAGDGLGGPGSSGGVPTTSQVAPASAVSAIGNTFHSGGMFAPFGNTFHTQSTAIAPSSQPVVLGKGLTF
jgi:hypothetical protein